jgi:hypothetical protein
MRIEWKILDNSVNTNVVLGGDPTNKSAIAIQRELLPPTLLSTKSFRLQVTATNTNISVADIY